MSGEAILTKSPVVCIITGASRGLGHSLALGLAKILHKDSVFILMARSVNLLQEVKNDLIKKAEKSPTDIIIVEFDQKKFTKEYADHLFSQILQPQLDLALGMKKYETCLLLHNAGTLGDINKKAIQLSEMEEMKDYFDINLNGLIAFNATCLQQLFASTKNRFVVNISSLTAIQHFKYLSLYCTGKAARDMFFKVLAAEEPTIRVLNYAPGPLDTDMQTCLRENLGDAENRAMIKEMADQGKLVKCEDTVQKLIHILCKNTFTSGDHIDFFD